MESKEANCNASDSDVMDSDEDDLNSFDYQDYDDMVCLNTILTFLFIII